MLGDSPSHILLKKAISRKHSSMSMSSEPDKPIAPTNASTPIGSPSSEKKGMTRRNSYSFKTINTSKYDAALDAAKSQGEDNIDSLEDKRIQLKKYLTSSKVGKYYENIIIFLCLFSTCEFIYSTYLQESDANDRKKLYILHIFDLVFASIFSLDWCLNIFLADDRSSYFVSFFSIVDLLIIASTFGTYGRDRPSLRIHQSDDSHFMYILFGCRTVRILRVLRGLGIASRIKDAVNRFLTEIGLSAIVLILFFASAMQYLEEDYSPFPFHVWTYYIWVTVSTVGYGDISPHSDLGRFAAMAMIGFAIVSVPKVTNELIEKMNLQSVYMRAVYSPKSRHSKHIVICGNLSSTSLNDFFEELFHEDHENVDLSAVILLPVPPTVDIIFLLKDPKYFLALHYLEGSALAEKDLKRAKAESAMAIFIMTNKFSSNPDEEDAKSILLSLSIKRYVSPFYRPSMLYCMQLIRPENRRHLSKNDANELEENDLVVCLNEIKMGAMAKAAMYPGSNTLLMNLVTSFSDDNEIGEEEEEEDINNIESASGKSISSSSKAWLKEYQQGCGWEIYTTGLSPMFEGAKFSELSYALYDKIGVVLFALQITDLRNGGSPTLLLNPASYCIPNQDDFFVEAFVIAENSASSDLSFSEQKAESSAMQIMNRNILSIAQKLTNTDAGFDRRKSSAIVGHGRMSIHPSRIEPTLPTLNETTEEKSPKKKVSKWKQLKRSALAERKVQSSSYQEVIHRLEDEHFKENYYVREKSVEMSEVTIKTSVLEELPYINNHLIVIGKGLRNLYDLIRPLRAKYLGPLRHIILLFPDELPHDVWQRISLFDAILILKGSPLEESNLRRAGIFRANQVVVLADGATGNSSSSGMEALVDSDAIFTYQHVIRMNPSTQVIIEIINESSISYLHDETGGNTTPIALADPKFSSQFASGTLFTTSLLDSIVCQAYYNPQIIKVVNKLISGIDQLDRAELMTKAAKELTKNEDDDSGSDSEDNSNRKLAASNDPKIKALLQFKSKNSLSFVKGSCMYQMNLPDDLPKKTYGSLYQHLATQGIIPLGLLRGTFANMNMGPKSNRMPYVFTNPDKDTEIYSCDKVFVLSQTPQRVSGKVDVKDWILEIQMQRSRDKAEEEKKAKNPTKSIEGIERLQRRLDERFLRFSGEVNKKLSEMSSLMEKIFDKKGTQPHDQYHTLDSYDLNEFKSEMSRQASNKSSFSAGDTGGRSRFNSNFSESPENSDTESERAPSAQQSRRGSINSITDSPQSVRRMSGSGTPSILKKPGEGIFNSNKKRSSFSDNLVAVKIISVPEANEHSPNEDSKEVDRDVRKKSKEPSNQDIKTNDDSSASSSPQSLSEKDDFLNKPRKEEINTSESKKHINLLNSIAEEHQEIESSLKPKPSNEPKRRHSEISMISGPKLSSITSSISSDRMAKLLSSRKQLSFKKSENNIYIDADPESSFLMTNNPSEFSLDIPSPSSGSPVPLVSQSLKTNTWMESSKPSK